MEFKDVTKMERQELIEELFEVKEKLKTVDINKDFDLHNKLTEYEIEIEIEIEYPSNIGYEDYYSFLIKNDTNSEWGDKESFTIACKKCKGEEFKVGSGSYLTTIKCLKCGEKAVVHDG